MENTFRAATGRDPKTHLPAHVLELQGRSPFQMNFAKAVAERPKFLHFTGDWSLTPTDTYRGPFDLSWYEQDEDGKDVLHYVWLGMVRVLVPERTV